MPFREIMLTKNHYGQILEVHKIKFIGLYLTKRVKPLLSDKMAIIVFRPFNKTSKRLFCKNDSIEFLLNKYCR